MPRYKLIIEKKLGSEYWVNDYHYTATDFADADSKAQPVIDAERAITSTLVTFTMYRISTVVPDDNEFVNFPLNEQGLHSNENQLVPLWVVLRADFPAVSGRSGRKYLRGVLTEDVVSFDFIVSTMITFLTTNYADPLSALDYLEKASGVLINECVINPVPAMRQLRKGSKRKVTPVIS